MTVGGRVKIYYSLYILFVKNCLRKSVFVPSFIIILSFLVYVKRRAGKEKESREDIIKNLI